MSKQTFKQFEAEVLAGEFYRERAFFWKGTKLDLYNRIKDLNLEEEVVMVYTKSHLELGRMLIVEFKTTKSRETFKGGTL